MREIPLSGPKANGRVLLVDDEDYPLMSRFKWYPKENKRNCRTRSDSKTGYKGVTSKRGGRGFTARIQGRDGVRRYLGWFHSPIEAALAYDEAAKELFGEFAWLNFPDKEVA